MTVQASLLTRDYDAKRRHAIAAATIGNGLEWFDFTSTASSRRSSRACSFPRSMT